MSHGRQQIRDALKAQLETIGPVSVSRVFPVESAELPIFLLYTNGETVTRIVGAEAYLRRLEVLIDCRAAGEYFDDDLDSMIATVEALLNDTTLGGKIKPLRLESIEVTAETVGKAYGSAVLKYEAIYVTAGDAPSVLI